MDENKNVKISDDVVQIIAGIAAGEVDGVQAMGNSIAGGIAELLGGKKPVSRGVKVDVQEDTVTIDVHVIVRYGVRIPDVAWKIQEKVKDAVETMTGLEVLKVNIHIDGINIEKESPAIEETDTTEETE
ncbi:MAG: Asp23/Gls24 family envelope stress response protein [Ruminococcaceae bacterium]|nr:Asp23/Gls24 family envelope stress response protein [Oscillospiraceae bacterium]